MVNTVNAPQTDNASLAIRNHSSSNRRRGSAPGRHASRFPVLPGYCVSTQSQPPPLEEALGVVGAAAHRSGSSDSLPVRVAPS
jgi:hypothetical protein